MARMIQFEYKGSTRQALEIEPDARQIDCLYCFQVTKNGKVETGPRSFKVYDMRDIVEIDRAPFEDHLNGQKDTDTSLSVPF